MRKTKTENILAFMNVLAWIAFIGLLVKSGTTLVSAIISFVNPDMAGKMYDGMDLSALRQTGDWWYFQTVSLMVAIDLLKAYTAYLVIRVLSKIKMTNPFTVEIAALLERISHVIVGAWIVAMIANAQYGWLGKRVPDLPSFKISDEFIFFAGVVFIMAQVFKKGVELQNENDLTV